MPIASAEETRKRHEAERARKEQRRRETRNQARNGRRKIRGFRGFDGEGETKWCTLPCECKQYVPRIDNEISLCTACGHKKDSHYHAYVLVGIGDKQIDTETLSIDEIGLEETFEFAYSQFLRPENRDCVFVGFFLGYDFNSIIKSIPNRLAWKLFNPYGNIHSESERKDKNDKRPCSSRKPTLSSRVRDEGKPYPVILTGKRGSWEFDTLDYRQLRLRPFNCKCADPEYHKLHCPAEGCTPDHHLTDKLCSWRDGECQCDNTEWHAKHCRKLISGIHPSRFHHSTQGCTRESKASVKKPEWMYISDVGSFFQKSFLSVINPEDWMIKDCTECQVQPCLKHETAHCPDCKVPACAEHSIVTREEYNIIKVGKERRENAVLDDDMRYYNRMENKILARVMEEFSKGLDHFGIHLDIDKWYGPGAAAGEWIAMQGQKAACASRNGNGVVTRENNPLSRRELVSNLDKVVDRAGRASYIAGWFEIFMHGHIPGTVYEYDVNSAYPDDIKDLPCMTHGRWEIGYSGGKKLNPLPKGAAFRLIHATVTGSNPYIGAMTVMPITIFSAPTRLTLGIGKMSLRKRKMLGSLTGWK